MSEGSDTDADRLAWWPAARGRGQDRQPLSRDQIVAAAISVVDAEGLEALSMRRLAQELGAGATSLYWHVKNKDELLDLVLDEVIGEVPLDDDPDRPWRERAAHLVRGLQAVLRRHPHVAVLFGSRLSFGPNALAGMDYLIGIFRSAGFDGPVLVLAYQTLLGYASGFAVLESRPVTGRGVEGRSVQEVRAITAGMLASVPARRYPNLATLPSAIADLTVDDQFEYGLTRLLDGMAADLERSRQAG
jgi:AcrR family transcriptional regulator